MSNKNWADFRTMLTHKSALLGAPISGVFELTARCNLQCKMCYICKSSNDLYSQSKELSTKQWVELFNQAREAGMLYVILTGGEVFLRADFKEIYEEIVGMGLLPTIYTNGVLLNQKKISWLRKHMPEKIEITMYGSSPEKYKAICNSSSAYQKVVNNINRILDAGIDLRLKTTVIQDNEEEYEKLFEFAVQRGVELQFCFYISPVRVEDSRPINAMRLNPKDAVKYLHKATEDYCKLFPAKKQHESGGNEVSVNAVKNEREDPFRCSVGKTDFWITWQGKLTGCGLMVTPMTDPLLNGFLAAWNELKVKLKTIPHCEECSTCVLEDICLSCPARLLTETGSFNRPSKYLCQFANEQRKIYT